MGKGKYKGRRAGAFIFDLDGTLIDSGLDIALAANFTRGHFGLPELPVATIAGYVGDGVAKLLQRSLGHDALTGLTGDRGLFVSEEMAAEGLQVFADHYGRHLLDNTRLHDGVLDVLARYRSFPLAVATNKPRTYTDLILRGLHIDSAFSVVVGGDETPARKPDPEHLRVCLARMSERLGRDLTPAETVVVGDSPNDVRAAQALGAVSVGCTFGLVAPGIIRSAGPDHVIDTFADLATLFPSRTG